MATSTIKDKPVYDEFGGSALDTSKWEFLQFPLPDGGSYICSEASASTETSDGVLRVAIESFQNSHFVQPMDNSKHLLLSTADFHIPNTGVTQFYGELSCLNINAAPRDYRDGFASLVVVDMASGSVFDLCATSDSVFAIQERLPLPGVDKPCTWVIEDPLAAVAVGPERFYSCRITIDADARSVIWQVDGVTLFEATVEALPDRVKLGLGIFTLRPVADGASRSLRGQGLAAAWRNVGTTAIATTR